MGVNGFTGSGTGDSICSEELCGARMGGFVAGPSIWGLHHTSPHANSSIACVVPVQGSTPHAGV